MDPGKNNTNKEADLLGRITLWVFALCVLAIIISATGVALYSLFKLAANL